MEGNDGWAVPWSRELAGRLDASPHPILPVYAVLHRTPPMDVTGGLRSAHRTGRLRQTPLKEVTQAAVCSMVLFGEGWLLRGWRHQVGQAHAVEVLLDAEGAVWSLDGRAATGHVLDVMDDRGRFGEVEGGSKPWVPRLGASTSAQAPQPAVFVQYEGVTPLHRHGFVAVGGLPEPACRQADARCERELYQQVAIPITAVLATAPPPDGHWIVGVTR